MVGEDSAFVNARIKDLEYFLVRINAHPILRSKPEFKDFLTYEREGSQDSAFTLLNGNEGYEKLKKQGTKTKAKLYNISSSVWTWKGA